MDAIYELFKEHYIKHLKDWSCNMLDPEPTTGKANVLVEHTNELADLRETLQNVVTNQNHLQEQYTTQVEARCNAYQPPPSVVTAPTSATVSTTANSVANRVAPSTVYLDFEGILQRAFQTQAALTKKTMANSCPPIPRQLNSTRSTQRHGHSRKNSNGAWHQWKYWCYSCGVNLKYNTNECD
mmetsp:Transcript_18047/g.37532  ORF Transcript_18047/g.37532 Transcript_18047/m.37532 type:complete len:183 (-) Transcript_18047:217-765(-)